MMHNPTIYAPSGQKSRAQEVCPIHKDIRLLNAQSHMHKRGVGYAAKERDSAGVEQGELFSTTEWEEVDLRRFNPPRPLKSGQSVDFACDYENKSDHDVIQGLASTDEMCMFIGLHYPRDRQTELCGLKLRVVGGDLDRPGTNNGAQTASCLANANAWSADEGASFFKCVVESCAAVSQHVSNSARCLATQGPGACKSPCSTDAGSCGSCVNEQCSSNMSALNQATCYWLYARAVGESAVVSGRGARPSNPSDPDPSYLLEKLADESPAAGSRLPYTSSPLPEEKILAIRRWIELGARND